MRARHICLGTGPANRPRLPGIPGVEKFKDIRFTHVVGTINIQVEIRKVGL